MSSHGQTPDGHIVERCFCIVEVMRSVVPVDRVRRGNERNARDARQRLTEVAAAQEKNAETAGEKTEGE